MEEKKRERKGVLKQEEENVITEQIRESYESGFIDPAIDQRMNEKNQ